MAAETFKNGDLVILKSGSPAMTIVHQVESPTSAYKGQTVWTCMWFETRGLPHMQSFPESALQATAQRTNF